MFNELPQRRVESNEEPFWIITFEFDQEHHREVFEDILRQNPQIQMPELFTDTSDLFQKWQPLGATGLVPFIDQASRRRRYGPSPDSETLLAKWEEIKAVLEGKTVPDIYNGEMFTGQTLLNSMLVKVNKLVRNSKKKPE